MCSHGQSFINEIMISTESTHGLTGTNSKYVIVWLTQQIWLSMWCSWLNVHADKDINRFSWSMYNYPVSMISERPQQEMPCYSMYVPGMCVFQREHASLLGSPIGILEGIQDGIRAKKETLEVLGVRLCYHHAHDALCLLWHAIAILKNSFMSYAPHHACFHSPELPEFDSLVISLLCAILNISLNDSA